MNWFTGLFHRGGAKTPYSVSTDGISDDPVPTIPSPQYGTGGPNPFMPGLSGSASSRGGGQHIVPGYHEPDRPQDR